MRTCLGKAFPSHLSILSDKRVPAEGVAFPKDSSHYWSNAELVIVMLMLTLLSVTLVVLCAEHLQARMGFQVKDIETLKSGSGSDIKRILENKQQEKTGAKGVGMRERKKKLLWWSKKQKKW